MPLDLSTFENLGRQAKHPTVCKICDTLADLKPAEAKVVNEAVLSESENVRRGVRKWLDREHGVVLSSAAMTAHRQRKGRCYDA